MLYNTYSEVYEWIEYSFNESFGMLSQHNSLSIDSELKESLIDGLTARFMEKYNCAEEFEAKSNQEYDVFMNDVDAFLAEDDQIEYVKNRLAEEDPNWDDIDLDGTYDDKPYLPDEETFESVETRKKSLKENTAEELENWDGRTFLKMARDRGPLTEEEIKDLYVKIIVYRDMLADAERSFNNIQDDAEAEDSDYLSFMPGDAGMNDDILGLMQDCTHIYGI